MGRTSASLGLFAALAFSGCDGPTALEQGPLPPPVDEDEPEPDVGPDPSVRTDPDPVVDPNLPVGFILTPDGGLGPRLCSLWSQDCPDGEKCNVWANDGGSAWNATKCVAVDPSPDKVGESCRVLGGSASGEDTCEVGAFCWDVDPNTGEGMCVNYCIGGESSPDCASPAEQPAIGKEFCLCLPTCDPTLNDCPVGCGCYGFDNTFQCVPDASGERGVFGDECNYINACDPGLACINPAAIDPDSEAGGICSRFCSFQYVDTCSGDLECIPWFEEGYTPPEFEHVGICGLPSAFDD